MHASSPSSCRRKTLSATSSMPERSDSRERVICASCEVGERLREMARWRSRRDSLIWSASSRS